MRAEPPSFTVVIPTIARPGPLSRCLEALARLDYPRDRYDVIVVDDGGPEPLDRVIAPFRRHYHLRLLRQPNGGPAAARNTGTVAGTGDYLAFTDDDCAPAPDWLSAFADALVREPDALVGGRIVNALEKNAFAAASQLSISFRYEVHNADPRRARFICSNNLVVPIDRLRDLGGFDTSFPAAAGEDIELCDRWRHRGGRMIYAPDAVVHHAHDLTLSGLWRQQFNYGRSAHHIHELRAQRGQRGQLGKQRSFAWDLLLYPYLQERAVRATKLSALLAVAQLANVVGQHWERARPAFRVAERSPTSG